MKSTPLLATLPLLLLAPACKTAGPRVAPPTTAPPDVLAAYVGELRLLPHGAEKARLQLEAGSRASSGCAVAVRVRAAAFVRGRARLTLETLGTPRVRERRVSCKRMQPEVELTVSGFAANPGEGEVAARLDAVLLTPEAFLASRNVRFDLPPAATAAAEAASQETFASAAETSLGRHVTAWPAPLLVVDPWHKAARKGLRQQSEVELDAIVGSDGRLQKPRLRTRLGEAHARSVLLPLPLWRFEPARRGDTAIAARVALRPVLHLY